MLKNNGKLSQTDCNAAEKRVSADSLAARDYAGVVPRSVRAHTLELSTTVAAGAGPAL